MRKTLVVLCLGIVMLLLIVALIQPIGARPQLKIEVQKESEGAYSKVTIKYSIEQSRFMKNVQAVCFPIQDDRERPVYVFTDVNNTLDQSYPATLGLYDHLLSSMNLFGSSVKVSLVDYMGLQQVFKDPNATLVFACPFAEDNTTRNNTFDWMMRGGMVVSVGEYSLPFANVYEKGEWKGDPSFLKIRFHKFNFTGGEGIEPTEYAEAMAFQFVAPNQGIDLDSVEALGGTNIGFTYDRDQRLTSLAMFTFGEGRLLTFSGDIRNPFLTSAEDVIAMDMAKVLLSGLPWISGPTSYSLESFGPGPAEGYLNVTMPSSETCSVMVFSMDNTQPVFGRKLVPLSDVMQAE